MKAASRGGNSSPRHPTPIPQNNDYKKEAEHGADVSTLLDFLGKKQDDLAQRACGKSVVIPNGVIAELRDLAARKPELRERVATLSRQLAALRGEGLVRAFGEQGETFGDKQILATATRMMTETELLVITQDRGLSEDLLRLNSLHSVHGKRLAVGRINRYGYLSRYIPEGSRSGSSNSFGSWSAAGVSASLPGDEP